MAPLRPDMPAEYLCPISRSLMGDPVVVHPSGHSFERSCIQACADLGYAAPGIDLPLFPLSDFTPNIALKLTIRQWCHRSGFRPPLPLPYDAAVILVRRLMAHSPPRFSPRAYSANGRRSRRDDVLSRFAEFSLEEEEEEEREEEEEADGRGKGFRGASAMGYGGYLQEKELMRAASALADDKDGNFSSKSISSKQKLEAAAASPGAPASHSVLTRKQHSHPHSSSSASSSSSVNETFFEEDSDILSPSPSQVVQNSPATDIPPPLAYGTDVPVEMIEIYLTGTEVSEHEVALVSLRRATRESGDHRIRLCTPHILAALRPMLFSQTAAVQTNATVALLNLSLEPASKVLIANSGVVSPIVEVLKDGHAEARDHAAAALFSLALEEKNRLAIGVLGAIPPLLDYFYKPNARGNDGRRDAGTALYYLSLVGDNCSKIARAPGAVRALLSVASKKEEAPPPRRPALERLAMMLICNLAGNKEGRPALMDGGAVAAVAALMRSPSREALQEYCVTALYGMSKNILRFRCLARAAGAELELMRVAEESEGGGGGGMRQKIAKKMLRAMNPEDDDEAAPPSLHPAEDGNTIVTEGMMSFGRRPHHQGKSRSNTANF
ncbi:U-box domain-containing protein 39-like [Curcuma longa]|uniref:U-box domain-containing protein 39-like n=1 Tax=Curcuma longa TaxID=136217 RepID=UPI003D9DBD3E